MSSLIFKEIFKEIFGFKKHFTMYHVIWPKSSLSRNLPFGYHILLHILGAYLKSKVNFTIVSWNIFGIHMTVSKFYDLWPRYPLAHKWKYFSNVSCVIISCCKFDSTMTFEKFYPWRIRHGLQKCSLPPMTRPPHGPYCLCVCVGVCVCVCVCVYTCVRVCTFIYIKIYISIYIYI